jgi:hypothetical protein
MYSNTIECDAEIDSYNEQSGRGRVLITVPNEFIYKNFPNDLPIKTFTTFDVSSVSKPRGLKLEKGLKCRAVLNQALCVIILRVDPKKEERGEDYYLAESLRQASESVASWPDWKKRAMRVIMKAEE